MSNLEAALEYHNLDLSVIPLIPGEKRPLIKWEPYQKKKASKKQIEAWWEEWPKANIGIVTGKISKMAVVDFDKYAPDYSEDITNQYFPDSIITPCAETPRGGQHLYFSFNDESLTINARALPGIDLRAEGGYIVAPPSVNGNGKGYKWIMDLRTTLLMPLPEAYINKINSTMYRDVTTTLLQGVTPVTNCDIWQDGTKDVNLFHIAHCLIQTKNNPAYVSQVLKAIVLSWGEENEKWIEDKIKSALGRAERKERNIQAEVDAFISVTSGDFCVTSCYNELQVVTKEGKTSVRQALSRRKGSTIEKVGSKDGWYRRIDTEVEHIDFTEEEGALTDIRLPLDLHEMVEICEGNIILVSGEYNAGKTTFALDTLLVNKNRMRIRYLTSEMRSGEFKRRWRFYRGVPAEFWLPDENTEYVALRNNLSALIVPDALNIIDYLEFRDGDYTQGAEYMRQIHEKLTTGVALVCNQQKEGARLPRSGDLIMEKPRLAVCLRKVSTGNDIIEGIAEIQKAKNVRLGKCDGKRLRYSIEDNGSRFKILNGWGFWKI